MTIPSLTAAPDLPDRIEQDQTTFDSRMAAYWAYLKNDFEPELNLITPAIDVASSTAATSANTATNQADIATTQANSAASSAQTALLAPGTSATSSTSLTTGTGSKTMTIQTGKSIVEGMMVIIANTGAPSNYMAGQVTSYTSGTGELIVNVVATGGSGTMSAWTVSLSSITFDAATQSEIEIGTESALRSVSPLRVKQSVDTHSAPFTNNNNLEQLHAIALYF